MAPHEKRPLAENIRKAYEILGINPDITDAEINKAYEAKMAWWNPPPDNDQLAKQKVAELSKAYNRVLLHRSSLIKNNRPSEVEVNYTAHREGHTKKLTKEDCIPHTPAPHSSPSLGQSILRDTPIKQERICPTDTGKPANTIREEVVYKRNWDRIETPPIKKPKDEGDSLYEAILGEKNRIYYLIKFKEFDRQGPGLKASWNWAAFLGGGFWVLYRKMYGWFFVFWGVTFISGLFSGILEGVGLPVLGFLLIFGTWIACTVFANSIYHGSVKKKIAVAQISIRDRSQLLEFLWHKGGVHTWVIWVCILLPVIGILAAIQFTAYKQRGYNAAELERKTDVSDPWGEKNPFLSEKVFEPAPAPAPEFYPAPAPAPESSPSPTPTPAPASAPISPTALVKPPQVKARQPVRAPAPISSEQEHFDRIRRAHPDFEKYRDNGALKAWIQGQPSHLRDSLLKTYNEGDADSVIALLTKFKKANNMPIVEAPARVPASAPISTTAEDWFNKAEDLRYNGEYRDPRKAIEYLNKAIRLKPDFADAYNNRGLTYADLKQYQSAIKDYDEAIRLKPDFAFAYGNRGYAYISSGNSEEGCRSLIRACELGDCKGYELSKQEGYCQSFTRNQGKQPQPPMDANISLKMPYLPSPVDADQRYRGIKGIVLKNETVIEGQIISMDPDTVKIRTKEGKVLSYDFKKEVERFITE